MNQFRPEDLNAAALAALALTNTDSDSAVVPMKHAAGALILREIMSRVLQGQLVIQEPQAPKMEPPPGK